MDYESNRDFSSETSNLVLPDHEFPPLLQIVSPLGKKAVKAKAASVLEETVLEVVIEVVGEAAVGLRSRCFRLHSIQIWTSRIRHFDDQDLI